MLLIKIMYLYYRTLAQVRNKKKSVKTSECVGGMEVAHWFFLEPPYLADAPLLYFASKKVSL